MCAAGPWFAPGYGRGDGVNLYCYIYRDMLRAYGSRRILRSSFPTELLHWLQDGHAEEQMFLHTAVAAAAPAAVRDRQNIRFTDRFQFRMSNQIASVTCAEYNRCRPYSEMLKYEPLTSNSVKQIQIRITNKTNK